MMDLPDLEQTIGELSGDAYPLEKWHPTQCNKMDMVIDVNGQWIHQGDVIKRDKLVVLFSKILLKEQGNYYLLTPAEKLQISVEDAPFVIVDFEVAEEDTPQQVIWLISNIGDRVPLSPEYNFALKGQEQRPYINLWRGLEALISRNVYYKLVDLAHEVHQQTQGKLLLNSCGQEFCLGYYER